MPITVTRDLSQPMRHVVQVREHQFAINGSVDEGGTDSGPCPVHKLMTTVTTDITTSLA